jgi:hypothetical protein
MKQCQGVAAGLEVEFDNRAIMLRTTRTLRSSPGQIQTEKPKAKKEPKGSKGTK